MMTFISRPQIIFLSALISIAIFVYGAVYPLSALLDEKFTAEETLKAFALLKENEELGSHLTRTIILDTILPFTLAAAFAGIIGCCGGDRMQPLAYLPFAATGFDLTENFVQIAALLGQIAYLDFKIVLTVGKFNFYGLGFVLSVIALGSWLHRRSR